MDDFLSCNNLNFVPFNDEFKKICMMTNYEFDKLENKSELYYAYGTYFGNKEDFDNMKKYYLMGCKNGNVNSMNNLGVYYEKQKDYENMKKYYLNAIEQGHSVAMCNYGNFYQNQ